ncbi:ABC transporter substrate-binding protein [Nocardia sp. NPDC051750]|uniref:ABC transporter substrate-binding protein n=1 Tax=Nocardia sp. NPDC051750 TaxID=3364325 RepID=UPI003793C705
MRAPCPRRIVTALFALLGVLTLLTSCALETSGPRTTPEGLPVIKVGYLHTLAVDSHMWLGLEEGLFEKHGVALEPVKFDTGTALSQALSGGSVDVAVMGAVLSNFPAQGVGKVFLANDIEFDTAQLWAAPSSGIRSVADLKGKQVITASGTTAHVFLHNALRAEGVDPSSLKIINADLPSAVSAFVSGQVPAVALWVPFDETVEKQMPDARMVASAKDYYPQSSIVGGWVANNNFHEANPELLSKITGAWLEANDLLINDRQRALTIVHDAAYADSQSLDDTLRRFEFARLYTNDEWAQMYASGDLERQIGNIERIFVEIGGIDRYVDPADFVDTSIYTNSYNNWKVGS